MIYTCYKCGKLEDAVNSDEPIPYVCISCIGAIIGNMIEEEYNRKNKNENNNSH